MGAAENNYACPPCFSEREYVIISLYKLQQWI
jgi:hypothetical protein